MEPRPPGHGRRFTRRGVVLGTAGVAGTAMAGGAAAVLTGAVEPLSLPPAEAAPAPQPLPDLGIRQPTRIQPDVQPALDNKRQDLVKNNRIKSFQREAMGGLQEGVIPADIVWDKAANTDSMTILVGYSPGEHKYHLVTSMQTGEKAFVQERARMRGDFVENVAISPTNPAIMGTISTDYNTSFSAITSISKDSGLSWEEFRLGGSDTNLTFSSDNKYVFTQAYGLFSSGQPFRRLEIFGKEPYMDFTVPLDDREFISGLTPARRGPIDKSYVCHALTNQGFRQITFTDTHAYSRKFPEYPSAEKLIEITKKNGETPLWLLHNYVTNPVRQNRSKREDINYIGTIIENTYGQYTNVYQPTLSLYEEPLNIPGFEAETNFQLNDAAYDKDTKKGFLGVTLQRYRSYTSNSYETYGFIEMVDLDSPNDATKRQLVPTDGDWPLQGEVAHVSVSTKDGKKILRAMVKSDSVPQQLGVKPVLLEKDITNGLSAVGWEIQKEQKRQVYAPISGTKINSTPKTSGPR